MVACSIYGSTLAILYLASTLYHSARRPKVKRVLRIIDHSAIYLLIAGTYTPTSLTKMMASMRVRFQKGATEAYRARLTDTLLPLVTTSTFPNLTGWRRLVELTTNHVGLVIAGDVNLVAGILRMEDEAPSYLKGDEKIRDLALWVLSRRFEKVRLELGLAAKPRE